MPTSAQERVEYVVSLMRECAWSRGRTGPELAAAWGLAKTTVEGYASEASRRVRAELVDPDLVQVTVADALREVIEGARADVVAREDVRAARTAIIQAGKTWADIVGASAPSRVRVEVTPASLTDAELRAAAVEAVRVLAREDPKLLEGLHDDGTPVPE